MSPAIIVAINLIVPGSGLVALRREWLGLAIAILYGLLAQVSLLGWLLVPETVPTSLTTAAVVATVLSWCGAQWLLIRRIRTSTGPRAERELSVLTRRSDEAVRASNLDDAYDILRAALKINDEHVATNRRWAELMALMEDRPAAMKANRRVSQHEDDSPSRGSRSHNPDAQKDATGHDP